MAQYEPVISEHVSINDASARLLCLCALPLQDLYTAGEGKFGTDEEKFITILGNRSTEHLREGEPASLIVPLVGAELQVFKQHQITC